MNSLKICNNPEKNQIKILEMKNSISQIKTSIESLAKDKETS
jgi:hypothetical protein